MEIDQSTSEENEIPSSNYEIKRVFETKINENKDLKKKLGSLGKSDFQEKGNEQAREIYSTAYDFTIETTSAIYINSLSENYHSYTFKIERENPEYRLENLILSYHDSLKVYHAYIQTYEITKEELNAINNEEYVDLEGKINLLSIDGAKIISDFFNKEMITINELCPITTGVCGSGDHTLGNQGDCNIPGTFTYTHTWIDCSWTLDPNEGVPGGGGGGNSGGGGGNPPPNDYDGSDPTIHGNGGGVTTSPNTGCRGAGCVVIEIEDPEEKDPCNILNNLMDSDEVEDAIDYLKTKTTGKIEYGYEIEYKYNSNDQEYQHDPILRSSSTDNLSVSLATGGHVQGGAHNHPSEGLSIPSWSDVRWASQCENNNSVFNDDTSYSLVVVKNPEIPNSTITYAVTINNLNALQAQINTEMNKTKILREPDLKDKLKMINKKFGRKFIDDQDDSEALEKKFLQVFENYGIDLYKRNEQTNNWEQLKIENNEVTPNPCGN